MKNQTKFIVALAILLVTLSVFNPIWAEWTALLLMIFAGIPHGSFDLRVAEAKWKKGLVNQTTVVSLYLFSALIMAGLFFLMPSVGFIIFILISFYHFIDGEVGLDDVVWRAFLIGFSSITLPIGLHLETSRVYMNYFLQPAIIDLLAPYIQLLAITCAALIAFSLLLDRNLWKLKISNNWTQSLVCLSAWLILPPLAGFCVWFIGRHSWEHIALCKSLFKNKQIIVPADFIVLSILAICLFLPLSFLFDLSNLSQLFTASIILIAGLTLPHVLVTHNIRSIIAKDN